MLYECHVTVPKPMTHRDREQLRSIAARLHWKTSEIDRDPALGDHVFFYFTSHSDRLDEIKQRMEDLRRTLIATGINVDVLRMKIEKIVLDWRKGQPLPKVGCTCEGA